MATKKIRSYGDPRQPVTGRVRKKEKIKEEAGREFLSHSSMNNMAKLQQAKADYKAARIDADRLRKAKPKGMSQDEWERQIREGTAMVQNPNEAKVGMPRYDNLYSVNHSGYKQIKKEGRQPTEFIITTVREPELIKKAARSRARRKK